jgi:Mg2+ and Co2+ transporter CorA
MLLLREEGSSVAFPEVIASIQSDTQIVADRLSKSQIDAVTQGIQADILVALEEMIEALQKAQRDLEEQRQQQQQGRPGQSGQGEQPLVQTIAELKLLRTMQTRVKSTTDRYSGLLESGEASGGEILPLLQDLSRRQNRLYQITRDLVLKRNQ